MGNISDRFFELTAGCAVDAAAARRLGLETPTLKKLAEAFRAGWLHNVMSRITPLTMQRMDDYVSMAELFVLDAESATHVLDRFDSDLELFCSVGDITVTEHMSMTNVSDELKAHVLLYTTIGAVFERKFNLPVRDPIRRLTTSPIMSEFSNPFIKEFIDQRFNRATPPKRRPTTRR